MKAVIVEDEKPAARRLQRMLVKEDLEVETMLHSVAEGIEWFTNNPHPDLIFLDIQLSDGLSFEIFEQVEVKSAVIFTTAYDEYALKAFKLNSIDYLLKPLDAEELQSALAKYKEHYQSPNTLINAKQLREMLSGKTYKSRYSIRVGQHLKIIETAEIYCFYTENKTSFLHTKEGRNYPLDTTLDTIESELNPEEFFRINRQAIIRLQAIDDIVSYSNSRLKLKLQDFDQLPLVVARERVPEFKKWLG